MAAAASDRHLAVLKRIDGATVEVLGHAGHVVLYEFEQDKQQWKRKGVEGPLFIAKRSTEPRMRLIVTVREPLPNLRSQLLTGDSALPSDSAPHRGGLDELC